MHVPLSMKVATLIAVFAAVGGGSFLGLFSCGAYPWQTPLVRAVIGVLACVPVGLGLRANRDELFPYVWLGLGFLFVTALIYWISESAAAPFYPSTPDSFAEFWRLFLNALENGPC